MTLLLLCVESIKVRSALPRLCKVVLCCAADVFLHLVRFLSRFVYVSLSLSLSLVVFLSTFTLSSFVFGLSPTPHNTRRQEMTARQMDALLDRLRVVRAFDVSRVMSALVAYIDGVMEGVSTFDTGQSLGLPAEPRVCLSLSRPSPYGPVDCPLGSLSCMTGVLPLSPARRCARMLHRVG